MSGRNTVRILIVLMTVFALCGACLEALAGTEPAIRFENEEISIPVKKTAKVTPVAENVENPKALKYTWTSGDEQIAAVQNGTVKGIAAGETTVTCSAELPDGKQLSCSLKVRVVEPVKTLKIETKANTKVKVGGTLAIEYTIQPENATDRSLAWESSDPAVATVDSAGVVTAVAPGKVNITAVTKDGSSKKARVALYIPSLYCEADRLDMADPAGADLEVEYFGADWDNDVTVKADARVLSYRTAKNGTKVTFHIDGEAAGSGKLEITDKKDPRGKVSVNVSVSQDAIPLCKEVYIQKISWSGNKGHIFVKNNTGGDITGVYLVGKFYNEKNELMFCTDGKYEDIGHEMCFWTKDSGSKDGTICIKKNAVRNWYGNISNYDDYVSRSGELAKVEIAVYRYIREDGSTVYIPDRGFRWFSSESQAYVNEPELMNYNCFPGREELERANTVDLGYRSNTMREWLAPHFGFRNAGHYVSEVEADSEAEKAGLKVHDLLVAVDGVMCADDAYMLKKGYLKLLDGKSITFTVERQGEEGLMELIIQPPAAK